MENTTLMRETLAHMAGLNESEIFYVFIEALANTNASGQKFNPIPLLQLALDLGLLDDFEELYTQHVMSKRPAEIH